VTIPKGYQKSTEKANRKTQKETRKPQKTKEKADAQAEQNRATRQAKNHPLSTVFCRAYRGLSRRRRERSRQQFKPERERKQLNFAERLKTPVRELRPRKLREDG